MPVPFALPSQSCGKRTLSWRTALAGAMILLLVFGLAGVNARAADDPSNVLKKMLDAYTNAKVYSATIIVHQKGKAKNGKAFAVTKTQTIQYKAPNLLHVVVTYVGEGEASGVVAKGNQTVVADGKTITAYSPTQKAFIKQPDVPSLKLTNLLEMLSQIDSLRKLPAKSAPIITLLAPDTIKGRPVFVVQIKPVMPAGLTPEKQKQWNETAKKANPLRLSVDKLNGSLLHIAESANGASLEMSLESQLFNGNIPGNAFMFTPPPGSKEIVRPAPQAGGGLNRGAPAPGPGLPPAPPRK